MLGVGVWMQGPWHGFLLWVLHGKVRYGMVWYGYGMVPYGIMRYGAVRYGTECVVLRCVALRCVELRCVALRCVALRCVALRCVALRCVLLRCVVVALCLHLNGGILKIKVVPFLVRIKLWSCNWFTVQYRGFKWGLALQEVWLHRCGVSCLMDAKFNVRCSSGPQRLLTWCVLWF